MSVHPQYLEYVLEQLAALRPLSSRRMFGGVGLYCGELFFGLIDQDTLFFKSDESNRADYTARNMPRFMPFPKRPDAVLWYYQVPADVIEDPELIIVWARKSVSVALSVKAAKAVRKPKAGIIAKKRVTKKSTVQKRAAKKPVAKKPAVKRRRR